MEKKNIYNTKKKKHLEKTQIKKSEIQISWFLANRQARFNFLLYF